MPLSFSDFVLHLDYQDLPETTRHTLRRSLLDTLGVAMVGSTTGMSRRVREFAHRFWAAGPDTPAARMLLDGRETSLPGAAMAGAFTIDAVDAHDGHRGAKGHAGAAVVPVLLAAAETLGARGLSLDGRDLLAAMAVGYEVSYRTALAQHATTPDYHTSGAWSAVGVAAMLARLLGLSAAQLREAVGIAEYHGPRSQMMRCIEFPTNLRDGLGWGAPGGVSAALLAELGFTGAPALTVESEDAAPFWETLGDNWEIEQTYYKPYPVCRWAHPALDGVAAMLARLLGLDATRLREAVGIAEYHGPRSQMMRCIEFPTNLRDGLGWGAPGGVSAALLAELGFTGAPALTVESADAIPFWETLGEHWEIEQTYYKPYPVCRWAHPALDGVAALLRTHDIQAGDIESIRVRTFRYATQLAGHAPQTLDEFCYGIAYPLATLAVRGQLGAAELAPDVLSDPEIQGLSQAVVLEEHTPYTELSPAERWADVTLYLRDGRVLEDRPRTARGDPGDTLTDGELVEKYHGFADPVVGAARAAEIRELSLHLDEHRDLDRWLALLHR